MAKAKKQTTNTEQRWRLVRDDDSHWYLIPAEKKDAFDLWVEASLEYFDGYEGEDFEEYSLGTGPPWITFTDPKVDA